MRHPFDLKQAELKAIDLNFEETLTDEEAQQVGGGLQYCYPIKPPHYLGPPIQLPPDCKITPLPLPLPEPCYPIDPPSPPISKEPIMTTLALGEEGGCPVIDTEFELM
jgi:hypothetical protein